jgi:5-methylcytosine-specific restriction endonuclease McrA
MQMFEELKNILAHQNYEGRMDVLMKKIAGLALEKLKPKRKESSDSKCVTNEVQPKASSHVAPSPAPGKTRSRYISVGVKRQILFRDQYSCTYRDPKTGRVCQSRYGLQFDHLLPFSQGGAHTAQNLVLKCGAHNRYRAEKMGLGRGKY